MLSSGIMRRAFVEAIVLGVACGPLGVWILLLKRAYAAESLSHAMLPGLVIAALTGIPLILGAAGGVLVAAVGIALVARDARAGGIVVVHDGFVPVGNRPAPRLDRAAVLEGVLAAIEARGWTAVSVERLLASGRARRRPWYE